MAASGSRILAAFRHVKWKMASLPVDVGRSKTSLLKFPYIRAMITAFAINKVKVK